MAASFPHPTGAPGARQAASVLEVLRAGTGLAVCCPDCPDYMSGKGSARVRPSVSRRSYK